MAKLNLGDACYKFCIEGVDQQVKKMTTGGQQAGRQFGAGFRGAFGRIATGLAGLVTTGVVALFVQDSIKLGAVADGIKAKFEATFGDSSKALNDFFEKNDNTFKATQAELQNAASSIGASLQAIKFDDKSVVDYTQKLLEMSAQLGAFNDVNMTEVLGGFQAALRGEFDTLERFNIFLNETSLQQRAVEFGLVKSTKAFATMDFATQKQIKTQALLKIAFEQSTKAREGFDANNNTLLQNQKEFEENIKEIKTTIGTEFLPVLNKLLQAITPIIDKIGKRVKENPKLTRNILLAVGAFGLLVTAISAVNSVISIFALANPRTLAIAGIVLAGVLIYKNRDKIKGAFERGKQFITKAMENVASRLGISTGTLKNILLSMLGPIGVVIANWDRLKTVAIFVWNAIKNARNSAPGFFKGLFDGISGRIDYLIGRFNALIDFVAGIPGRISSAIGSISIPGIGSLGDLVGGGSSSTNNTTNSSNQSTYDYSTQVVNNYGISNNGLFTPAY